MFLFCIRIFTKYFICLRNYLASKPKPSFRLWKLCKISCALRFQTSVFSRFFSVGSFVRKMYNNSLQCTSSSEVNWELRSRVLQVPIINGSMRTLSSLLTNVSTDSQRGDHIKHLIYFINIKRKSIKTSMYSVYFTV